MSERKYEVGILIIGSLMWDNEEGRPQWRSEAFGENYAVHSINLPIRYGRFSEKRNCYTMVISSSAKLGKGLVIPIQRRAITLDQIVEEAKKLSRAEGANDNHLIKGRNEKWCMVSNWINPKLNDEETRDFLNRWQKECALGEQDISSKFKIGDEQPIFDKKGTLNLPWPIELDSFDIILATQTSPRRILKQIDKYPSDKEIAQFFFFHPEYFIKNRLVGIHTAEDDKIIELMAKSDLLSSCRNAGISDADVKTLFPSLKYI